MKGEYTVNVSDAAAKVLTLAVEVEDEKVESIEILSDIAIVNDTATPTSATVGYQVKNQYGEDITKTTGLTTNNAGITANNGVVTLDNTVLGAQAKIGDKIAVALVHAESAKSATKVVTLSAQASVADIEIKGLYNKDGKELNEGTNLGNDKFYLLVEAKDQYGNVMTDNTSSKVGKGLIKSETNTSVVGTATDVSTTNPTLTSLTIDGKKVLGLELTGTPKAGESQVTLISTTTGKNAAYKIVVKETTRTDVVNLSSPALAVANEDILVPVSVINKDGNIVSDIKVLNDTTGSDFKGVKVTFAGTTVSSGFVKDKDGNIFIKVTSPTDGTFPLVAQSSTFKVATLTIKVEKVAVAKTVRGLKDPLALAATKTKTLTVKDIVVEDQYGRVMDSDKVLTATTGILVRKADTSKDIVTLPSNESPATTPANNTIKDNVGIVVTAGSNNGSQVLQFLLAKNDGTEPVAASVAETTVRVTDGTEYTSYEIAEIGLTQAADVETAGAKEFIVNGILNGGKVALVQGDDFTATISGGVSASTAKVEDGEITIKLADLKEDDKTPANKIDTEFTLKVTINATGQVLEQKFTVSPDKRKVVDFYFTNGAAATDHDDADKVTEVVLKNAQVATTAGSIHDDATPTATNITVATTDQYGNEAVVAIDNTMKVTIVPEKVGQVTIADNGTKDAKATLVTAGTEVNVTIKLAIGNVVKEIKAVVK